MSDFSPKPSGRHAGKASDLVPPKAYPLPKRLLPEARGYPVTRLRASLRRPPVPWLSLS